MSYDSAVPTTTVAMLLCAATGYLTVALMDLRPAYAVAMYIGLIGISALALLEQRRILLVATWVFLHPLSVEKVIPFGTPLLPEFFPPALIISASDIALALLTLVLIAEGRSKWTWSPPLTPFCILVLWSMSVYLIQGGGSEATLANAHIIKMFVFLVVMSSAIRTRNEYLLVLATIVIALLIQLGFMGLTSVTGKAFSFFSKASGDLMTFSGQGQSYSRLTGTVGHVASRRIIENS